MTRRYLLAWALVPLLAPAARAQVPIARSSLPSRTALGRVGLERHWSVAIPLQFGTERVLNISMDGRGMSEREPGRVKSAPATPAGFISASDLSPHDDFYKGGTLAFTGGALKGQSRDISGYSGNTHAFRFDSAFSSAPADGDTFEIKGFNEKIAGAVADAPATAGRFMSDSSLSPREDFYVGATLFFTSGELQGSARDILNYDAKSRTFEFAEPFPDAPADGDTFAIRGGLVFAQTNFGNLHAFEAETGRHLWTASLGARTADARPAVVNSYSVFATNSQTLHSLDRETGQSLWKVKLEDVASSAPAANEDRVAIGMKSGKLVGFAARDIANPGNQHRPVTRAGEFLWAWKTAGNLSSRPIFAEKLVAFASNDGKLYVAVNDPPKLLYRFLTGGPISADLGTFGARTILVPSEDRNVYAVDLYNAERIWMVPTGAPVRQAPLVTRGETPQHRHEAFIVNSVGTMFAMDPDTGQTLWNQATGRSKLLAIGRSRIYLETEFHDLFMIARSNGAMLFSPRETFERAGLNLRDYALGITNSQNDRLYFATTSGSLLCLREAGALLPHETRDPKLPRFGVLPQDGGQPATPTPGPETETPPPAAGAGEEPGAEPGNPQ